MTPPLPASPHMRSDPYGPNVPRKPKNFQVASMFVTPIAPVEYIPTGPYTAVPARFEAHIALDVPAANVTIEVFVDPNRGPTVQSFTIRPKGGGPIGTTMLRQVPVDQLLQDVVAEATVAAAANADVQPARPTVDEEAGPETSSQDVTLTARERTQRQAEQDARTAARLWSNAVASGSKRPGVDVGREMNRSRAQVARYVRHARELGLLPPATGSDVGGQRDR
ncbi:hypothetical protein GCM10029964_093520 [Kibdelosporangium lantanae]